MKIVQTSQRAMPPSSGERAGEIKRYVETNVDVLRLEAFREGVQKGLQVAGAVVSWCRGDSLRDMDPSRLGDRVEQLISDAKQEHGIQ